MIDRQHGSRRVRHFGLLSAVLLLLTFLVPGVAVAAPFGPYAQTLSFEVTDISPQIVTATSGTTVRVQGAFTNTGDLPITDLNVRFHRGDALADTTALQTELADPSQPAARITPPTPLDVPGDVGPGAVIPFDLSIDLLQDGLQVPGPGVYPFMVNINGALVNGDSRQDARVGELHLVVTVLSLPDVPAPAVPDPLQVSTVRTLTDVPHLGIAGVFLDDDLTTSVAPGGRLDLELAALEAVPEQWAPTLVLDPMLVDELYRMTQGYRVVSDPAVGQLPLTPDDVAVTPTTEVSAASSAAPTTATSGPPTSGGPSTTGTASASAGSATDSSAAPDAALTSAPVPTSAPALALPGTVDGTGGPAAQAFLNRLIEVVDRTDTIVLPYGNPDAVALVAAGMTGTLQTLATQGREVAAALLPASVRTDVAVPPGGWTDEATLSALGQAGYTSAVVVAGTVNETVGARATLTADGIGVPAVVAGAGDTRWWSDLFTSGTAPAVALNTEIAGMVLHAGQGPLVGPLVLFDQAGTGPAAETVAQALVDAGLIVGAPLPAVDPAAPVATVAVPDEQRAQLLDPAYLADISGVLSQVPAISAALTQADPSSPDPAALFAPLTRTHATLYAAALRSDPARGRRVLDTIDGTLDQLRSGVSLRFGTSYSLASSSSPLIFTVQNQLPYVARLQVRIEGGVAVGLEITDNEVHTFPPGRTETVTLTSHVARSGSFSVDVGLETADGVVWAQPQPVTVNSSAYGFVTILIIVIAGAVLVVMVAFRIVQRIRQRGRPDPDPLVDPADVDPAGVDPAGADPTGAADGTAPADRDTATGNPVTDQTSENGAPSPDRDGPTAVDDPPEEHR